MAMPDIPVPPATTKPRQPWMPFVLAMILTIGFFSTLSYAITHVIPPESKDVVVVLIGELSTVWAGSMGYYFWTTAGSARKTEMLAQSPAVKID